MPGFLVVTIIVVYTLASMLIAGKSYTDGYTKGIEDGAEIVNRLFDFFRMQSLNEYNKGEINNGK